MLAISAALCALCAVLPPTPRLIDEPPVVSRSLSGAIQSGMTGLFTTDSAGLLAFGGGTALAVIPFEDPGEMREHLEQPRLEGGVDVGDVYGHGLTVAGGSAALMLAGAFGHAPSGVAGRDLMASFLVSAGVTWGLKTSIGRPRPLGGPHSFPSGHTASAFSTVPILYHHAGPWVGTAASVMAVGTALGRMEDQRHYLSDVIFGAAVGLAVGNAVVGNRIPWASTWEKLTVSGSGLGMRFRF